MTTTNIRILDSMLDNRINCHSIMLKMNVSTYLDLIENAYKDNGGIEGQRQPLSTKSAKRIRETMRYDIEQGTVLPPLVIGCVVENLDTLKSCLSNINSEECIAEIHKVLRENTLSIIDGMQRTTALKELSLKNVDKIDDKIPSLRIELWITDSTNNLIYRMLVLNTGQISWGLKKQLEVVFSHVKKELLKRISGIELLESNDLARSTKPKQYQLSHLVELYLTFSSRKVNIKLNEEVAERYAQQDVIENSSNQKHLEYFIGIIEYVVKLDEIFSQQRGIKKRLFGDQNARNGFIAALASEIFGRPGAPKFSDEKTEETYNRIIVELEGFVNTLDGKEKEDLVNFCDIEGLDEKLNYVSKKEMGEFYRLTFSALTEMKFDISNGKTLAVCWNRW